MDNLNSVLIEGNLVADPELKQTPKGASVCTFAIGVNRSFKDAEGERVSEVSFFDVTAFGKQAEACEAHLAKGRGVRVVGQLKQDRWEKDGVKHSRVKIIAEHVEFKPVAKQAPEEEPGETETESL